MTTFSKVLRFFKNNIVLTAAIIAALVTMVIVPPDRKYLSYIDFKTLSCLFCVLAVVCAFKNINFFYVLARKIIAGFKNLRLCVIALVFITFVGSMLIANDMALLTFLPLGYFVLHESGQEKYMAHVFILQNIAANLGGMLTPFGNPQNLFLYTKFNIPTFEFVKIMFMPFAVSIGLILICCVIFIRPEPLVPADTLITISRKRTLLYTVLFLIAVVMVFRVIPYRVGLIIIPCVLIFVDIKALKSVDFGLLGTFFAFFIFAGNMARIDVVRNLFAFLLGKNTLLTSVFSCQIISNVPSAILLSQFTDDYKNLLLGVNIGGTGTLIASLASLITFNIYRRENPGKIKYYIGLFSAYNFSFLIILVALIACLGV